MGTWGASPSAFVSFVLRAVPSSSHVWGGTWEGGNCEERNADFAGETRISLERAWGLGGLGLLTSSYVLSTLALEVALCQSASFPIAQSGARGGGRRCRGVEWGGGMILSRNRPLVNCKKLNLNLRQRFLSSTLSVRKIL